VQFLVEKKRFHTAWTRSRPWVGFRTIQDRPRDFPDRAAISCHFSKADGGDWRKSRCWIERGAISSLSSQVQHLGHFREGPSLPTVSDALAS
jgi:hypothetical protein